MKIGIKDSEKIFRILYIVIMLVIVVSAVMLILEASVENSNIVSVGCIFAGSVTEDGRDKDECESVSGVCRDLGISITVLDKVSSDKNSTLQAVKALSDSRCSMVFFESAVHAAYAKEISARFPKIAFFVRDPKYISENVSYFGEREYQERFLSGIIAGRCTKTGVLGFVAPAPDNEVNLAVNAFTAGVKRVNSGANVLVRFISSGYQLSGEYDAVKYLTGKNADIISYHSTCPDVAEACEETGTDFIGADIAVPSSYSHLLLNIGRNSYRIYENTVQNGMNINDREFSPFWIGIPENALSMDNISSRIPEEALSEAEKARNEIVSGRDVFSGYIRDEKGHVRCEDDETLSDRILLTDMYWLIEGVVSDG